jgi:hypothetical protein
MGTPRKKKLIAIKTIIGNQSNLGNQKFGFFSLGFNLLLFSSLRI